MEWIDIEPTPDEQFCRVEYFEVRKPYLSGHVHIRIALKEYLNPPDPAMKYVATAERQTNQRTAPFTPCGWGNSKGLALWECLQAIRKFPFEPLEEN